MDKWLRSAIDYIGSWIEFQQTTFQQPGVMVAFVHRGEVVAEHAFGLANLDSGEKITPRHRFRIASHSKSFTSAGIMKLREQHKLRLDDPIGQYVVGLHPRVAETTIAQVLSHSAGLTRDGADSSQFIDNRPYLNARELAAELKLPTAIEPGTRFKYSNHGFGLIGLLIEAVTNEPYPVWIKREIIEAAGLRETEPDAPLPKSAAFARGHTRKLPIRRAMCNPRRQSRARHGIGRRLRRDRRRYGPLLRAARAQCEKERAIGREPPRDDAKPLARAAELRRLLRPRRQRRQDRRLGLVRPWRRLSGLHLADLLHPRLRARDQHPQQLHRRRGAVLDGRRDADPARV
ncbi:CubicO group peptidase (beta-lactamase class C family) [Bradyrhizobium sp. LM6.10]